MTPDWRDDALARLRALIQTADPEVVETIKWRKPTNPAGVSVWEHAGILCTGGAFKNVVKLTFARGASLDDPTGLFNSGFKGGTRRAIDLREGEWLDETAFKTLIQSAVVANLAAREAAAARKKARA